MKQLTQNNVILAILLTYSQQTLYIIWDSMPKYVPCDT